MSLIKFVFQSPKHIYILFFRVFYYFILCFFNVIGNRLKLVKGIKGTKLKIRNYGTMSIGDNTVLSTINAIGDCHPFLCLYSLHGAFLSIGSGTKISNSTIFAANQIIIGNNVFIGADCKIYDHDFHSIKYKERMSKTDSTVASKPVEIKDGAWIGAHSIILKGTVIGKRSVVGAGSVVAGKIIGDDEIWAGNPCRFIKRIDQ